MTDDCEAAIASPTAIKRRAVEAGCCMWAPILPPVATIEPGLKADGAKDAANSASIGVEPSSAIR